MLSLFNTSINEMKFRSTFGALLHFQYHSCEDRVYFVMDFSTAFIQSIQSTEVTSDHQELYRCIHCARLESKY